MAELHPEKLLYSEYSAHVLTLAYSRKNFRMGLYTLCAYWYTSSTQNFENG